ncbi:MAG: hypothetical protein IBV52_08450 [Candidatus Bathyarchaeota archaeon]
MKSDKPSLKIWRVEIQDHEIANRIGRRDETQADIFYRLITEPEILKILDEKLDKANLLNEKGKKGNANSSLQAANLSLSALKEIREILLKRIRQYFSDEDRQELQAIIKKVKAIEPLIKDEDKYAEGEKEEVLKRMHAVTNDLARFMGEPLSQ